MIHGDELPAFMEEVRRRAHLACDNKPEYVRALRERPTWYRFGNDEIGYWKNAGYRYDFYEKPNKFTEMMMQNKIAAYLSDRRQGSSNLMDILPLLTFKNEKEDVEYLHFYCIEDLCGDNSGWIEQDKPAI
jgi:hypothetical protein